MNEIRFNHNNNFVIVNDQFATELAADTEPTYIFIYKYIDLDRSSYYILRKVDIEFTQQTQCGYLHKYNDEWLFENLAPENQQIFYDLDLSYNCDHKFIAESFNSNEYRLCPLVIG
ncbi:MAG: hypothetical protein R3Y22_02685 [Bacteroidales bacterium]